VDSFGKVTEESTAQILPTKVSLELRDGQLLQSASLIIISAPITTWDRGGGEGLPQKGGGGFSGLNTKKKNNHLGLNAMNNPRKSISGDTINNPGQ
jgi:hypothetical protein